MRVSNSHKWNSQLFESAFRRCVKNGRAAGLVAGGYRETKLVTRGCGEVGLIARVLRGTPLVRDQDPGAPHQTWASSRR